AQAVARVKKELPKTNSASLSGAGFAGIISILTSFGLASGKKRRNKK
ncbi:LPXTG-motif cell wall anchor domain-containing protein, partial [Streptococcus equinus]